MLFDRFDPPGGIGLPVFADTIEVFREIFELVNGGMPARAHPHAQRGGADEGRNNATVVSVQAHRFARTPNNLYALLALQFGITW
jgi:hypothetical protein